MAICAFDSSGKEPNQHRTFGTSSEGSGGKVGTYDDMVTVRSDYESSEVGVTIAYMFPEDMTHLFRHL